MNRMTRKIAIAVVALAATLGGLEIGEELGVPGIYGPVSEAAAIIGRPLTPLSYAGVARRTTRRAVVAGAAVIFVADCLAIVRFGVGSVLPHGVDGRTTRSKA